MVPRGEKLEIVAGERRWRAARLAGLARVPVVVRERTSDRDLLEVALVENLQREDLNPLEAAEAYARLREEFHLTQEDVARRVGKDRATVANALRLLKLPASVRERIRDGSLSAGHARALAALSSADDQELLRRKSCAAPSRSARRRSAWPRIFRARGLPSRASPRPLHPGRGGEALRAGSGAGPDRAPPPGRPHRDRLLAPRKS